ncbi:hypothetical protein B0H19DRAFT_1056989 [Mycena capillaripes]|nr:hypothetical protein B0H19DRAFT_1056989 [Mycena capillaripes]
MACTLNASTPARMREKRAKREIDDLHEVCDQERSLSAENVIATPLPDSVNDTELVFRLPNQSRVIPVATMVATFVVRRACSCVEAMEFGTWRRKLGQSCKICEIENQWKLVRVEIGGETNKKNQSSTFAIRTRGVVPVSWLKDTRCIPYTTPNLLEWETEKDSARRERKKTPKSHVILGHGELSPTLRVNASFHFLKNTRCVPFATPEVLDTSLVKLWIELDRRTNRGGWRKKTAAVGKQQRVPAEIPCSEKKGYPLEFGRYDTMEGKNQRNAPIRTEKVRETLESGAGGLPDAQDKNKRTILHAFGLPFSILTG